MRTPPPCTCDPDALQPVRCIAHPRYRIRCHQCYGEAWFIWSGNGTPRHRMCPWGCAHTLEPVHGDAIIRPVTQWDRDAESARRMQAARRRRGEVIVDTGLISNDWRFRSL